MFGWFGWCENCEKNKRDKEASQKRTKVTKRTCSDRPATAEGSGAWRGHRGCKVATKTEFQVEKVV